MVKAVLIAALYGVAFVLGITGFALFYGADPFDDYRDVSQMVVGGVLIAVAWGGVMFPLLYNDFKK